MIDPCQRIQDKISANWDEIAKNQDALDDPDFVITIAERKAVEKRIAQLQQENTGLEVAFQECMQPPTASFTATPAIGVAPLSVQLDASASSARNKHITSYTWNFGDGGTASGSIVSHTYANTGAYTVTLTITDEGGFVGFTTGVVTVSLPREQIKVPICPVALVSDEVLFEQPADASKKLYLPRYQLAEQIVSGQKEYRMTMEANGQRWSLALHLETSPAPVPGATILPHTATVSLSYSDARGGHKDLPFQEITMEDGGLRAALQLDTLPDRDQVYFALTDQKYECSLIIQSTVDVAVPVSTSGPTTIYQEVTRTLDTIAVPHPFVFPHLLYDYIFKDIVPISEQGFRLTPRQVGAHIYYQDSDLSYLFYYLPDAFKIARQKMSSHTPMMRVRFKASESDPSPQAMQVILSYTAYPFVNMKRLEADKEELKRYIQDPLPAGVSGLELLPLAKTKTITYRLGLPGASGASGPYQERPEVVVDLFGFQDELPPLSITDFQLIYDAIFSSTGVLFEGVVEVNLGSGPNALEVIPFIGRMNDMVGDIFDITETPDDATKGLSVVLQNGIESPVEIKSLSAELHRGQATVAGVIQGLGLPVTLQPNDTITCVVTPASPLNGSDPLHVTFDFSNIEVLPDKEKIYDVILDSFTTSYERKIQVKTFKSIFDSPQDHPENQILVFNVQLRRDNGPIMSLELTAHSPEVDATTHELERDVMLPYPVRDYVLGKTDLGTYEYSVTAIQPQQSRGGTWKTRADDVIWATEAEVN